MTDFTRASHQPSTAAYRSARRRSAHRVIRLGRAVDFEVWVDDLQLFLQCDRADGLSLFDLTSGASPAPPATADSTVRSQWATRDAAARLAMRRHLPTTERAHFSQYRSAQTLYDTVVARYSSPATAALSRLFLPYLFPDLVAFPTVADLITHLRTSDTRYRAALPAEFCAKNPPPLYLTLYYVVTRLPDSLRVVRDHFLSVCPTTLTVDLLEERLLAAEQSIVAVGASRGDPRTPIFEGCSPSPLLPSVASAAAADPSGFEGVGALMGEAGEVELVVEAVEGVGVVVGVVVEVEVSAAAVEAAAVVSEGAAAAVVAEAEEVAEAAEAVAELVAALRSGGGGQRQQQQRNRETPSPQQLCECDEGDCYLCVPPDPGIEAAALGAGETVALGASASAAPGAGESAPSGTASAQVFHTFTLDSGASRSFFRDRTTLTPLSRPVAVSLADPSGGPVLASFSTVLPCPAAPSGSLSGLYLPSFSTNLRGGTEPGGAEPGGVGSARVASCGASSRRELLSPQELREWFARRWSRAAGAGGITAAAGSGGTCPGGAGATGPGGAAEAAGVGPAGAAGAAGADATGGAGVSAGVGTSVGAGVGAAGAGGATGAGAAAGSPGTVPAGPGGATRPRPYFVPLLEQVLGLPPSPGPPPPLECPRPVQSQSQLQPVSPLSAPSPYTGPTGGLSERHAPASRPASPARTASTSRRTSRPRPPAVPGTHQMALRPSTAPLRVPLPSPHASSLPVLTDPASDSLRAASPTVACFLAAVVTDPSLESTAASALVTELVDFAAGCRLDYAASLVAESESVCPPSVGGECALSTDVLEDRQEEFQCLLLLCLT
ncbi:unnamed protein product [Closterium sp. NIES-54]